MTEVGMENGYVYTDKLGLPLKEILDFLIKGDIDSIARIEKTYFGIKIPFEQEIHIKLNNTDSFDIESLKQSLEGLIINSQKERSKYQKLKNNYDSLILEMAE